MEITKTYQRHHNIRKALCILTIPNSKINLALNMKMTPKSFCRLRPDGPFENTVQHWKLHHIKTNPLARRASQCSFHMAWVLTRRCLWADISIVIIPTLLRGLYCWFGVSLWCHNLPSCALYCLYLLIILVRLFKILSSLWSATANFLFRHNMHQFVCWPSGHHDQVIRIFGGHFTLRVVS